MISQLKKSVQGRETNTELAHSLVREYKKTRWIPNSERIDKPDTLSARYSIQEMEDFLAQAKEHGSDGIKFYFGAFPKDFAGNPDYAGRQTLVMVATKNKKSKSGNRVVKDIYVSKNGKAKLLSGLIPIGCPPRCFPSTEGGTGDLGITLVDRGAKGMEIV